MIDLLQIRQIVETSWSYETSYCDDEKEYHRNDPAYFQCKVTAAWIFSIMPVFEGNIMIGIVDGREHAWNRINGMDIDLTWRQFMAGSKLENIQLGYCYDLVPKDNKWMTRRYNLFKKRCDAKYKKIL